MPCPGNDYFIQEKERQKEPPELRKEPARPTRPGRRESAQPGAPAGSGRAAPRQHGSPPAPTPAQSSAPIKHPNTHSPWRPGTGARSAAAAARDGHVRTEPGRPLPFRFRFLPRAAARTAQALFSSPAPANRLQLPACTAHTA